MARGSARISPTYGRVTLDRGTVHETNFPGLGRRPALVVSWDAVDLRLRQPILARITTADRQRWLDTFVAIGAGEAGLERDSVVLCHELVTVPAEDVGLLSGVFLGAG